MDIRIASTRSELGVEAGKDIANAMRERMAEQAELRIIFAAAPSQGEMLQTLVQEEGIDWSRVTAFHMDEYIGLPEGSPQRFGVWLRQMIFDCVPFKAVHLLEPGSDLAFTCREYARKLQEHPIDFVLLGIGANGHLAFNDPPADLHDPFAVKVVTLDEQCRQQQVDDECFLSINDVPQKALTLTVPSLLRGHQLFCCAPGASKRKAARSAVHDPISGDCPATALRLHPRCTLYLDRDSSAEL